MGIVPCRLRQANSYVVGLRLHVPALAQRAKHIKNGRAGTQTLIFYLRRQGEKKNIRPDLLKRVFFLNVRDFVPQDGSKFIIGADNIQQTARDKNIAAGRGESVRGVRIQNRKPVGYILTGRLCGNVCTDRLHPAKQKRIVVYARRVAQCSRYLFPDYLLNIIQDIPLCLRLPRKQDDEKKRYGYPAQERYGG